MRLIDTCSVDVSFTPEERWVWAQMTRMLDDRHPDAHSARIKLSLSVMYSDNRCEWDGDLHVDVDGYLSKLPHVSSCCRLSLAEELAALQR